jgi:hypothetical protein
METDRSAPTLAEVEREHILSTLVRCGGNRTLTANVLGISVRGLRMKLHGYQQAGFEIAAPNQSREVTALSSRFSGRPADASGAIAPREFRFAHDRA